MSTQPPLTFGVLLRRYRLAAGLTQEELAERARLSLAAINTLERGARLAPRKETVALLAEALALTASERAELEAAARRHGPALPPAPTFPTPAEAQPTSLETPSLPEDSPPQLSGPQAPGRFFRVSLPLPAKIQGKLSAGLLGGLLVVALLGSALSFKVWAGGALAGPHSRTLCLAVETPTSDSIGNYGKPLENAANLAVMQNQNLGSGYTLKAISYDETPEDYVDQQAGPESYVQNMTDVVNNPCIVGMVGPFKSYVAKDEMPIAAKAGLVVISPINTNPALTLRPYAETQGINFDQLHPPGKPINYFRLAPTDASQAVADADVTFDLGARSVYLVNASDTEYGSEYGDLLVSDFTQRFEGKGGRIVGIDNIETDLSVIPAIAARIAAAHPDAVFYGGVNLSGGGLLKADLVKQGYTGLFVGSDSIANMPDFVQQAGVNAANGTYASIPGRDVSTFTSGPAATFIRDYVARYPVQNLNVDGAYTYDGAIVNGAYAYDAAMMLITACKNLIRAGKEVTRAALIEQVQHIQYAGVTGPISFDTNGDIAHGVFSIYTVQDGQWVYAWQVSV